MEHREGLAAGYARTEALAAAVYHHSRKGYQTPPAEILETAAIFEAWLEDSQAEPDQAPPDVEAFRGMIESVLTGQEHPRLTRAHLHNACGGLATDREIDEALAPMLASGKVWISTERLPVKVWFLAHL